MILVTGATGFLGKDLVPELAKLDDVRVFTRRKFNFPCEIAIGDIANYEDVEKAMTGVDYVFHLAKWKGHNAPYKKHYPITVLGTENIMRAAVKNGVKKVIYMSTVAVETKTETNYVRAKREAEKIVRKYWKKIDAPIIRAALIYDKKIIRKLRKYSLCPFPYKKQKIRLSYKKTVIEALINAMKYGKSEVYNVGDKECILLTDLYKELARPRRMLFLPPQIIWLMIAAAYPVDWIYRLANRTPPFSPKFIKYIFEDRCFDIGDSVKKLKYKPVDTLEMVRLLK